MKRLTRPTVKVDETAAQYMAAPGTIPTDLRSMNDRLLDLVINGPTLNGVNKDVLRQLIRQLYAALMPYEDTGLEPDMIEATINGQITLQKALEKYTQAEEQGRLVVLPCKVGTKVWVLFDNGTGKHLYETRVQGISVSVSGEDVILNFGGYPVQYAWGREVGKTVFLTREEAERALDGGKNDGA